MAVNSYSGGSSGVDEGSYTQLDLSGKLIIKAQLGDDIRRIPIHNEEITYDELVLMMQRVFRGKLDAKDEVLIKYKDEDGDLISIFDSSDLSFAIQCSRILKLTILVNSVQEPLQSHEVRHFKKELQKIRNQVNQMIDQLEPRSTRNGQQVEPEKAPVSTPPNAVAPKEFDPLNNKESVDGARNKVGTSFSMQEDGRVGSPDSISSLGSSASQKQPQPATSIYQGQQQVYNNPYYSGPQQLQSPTSSAGSFGPSSSGGYVQPQQQQQPGYAGYQQQQNPAQMQQQNPAQMQQQQNPVQMQQQNPAQMQQQQQQMNAAQMQQQNPAQMQQNPSQMLQQQYGQPQQAQNPQQMGQQVRGSPFAPTGPPNQGPSPGPYGASGPPTSQHGPMRQQYPAGPQGGVTNPYSRGTPAGYPRPGLNYPAGY